MSRFEITSSKFVFVSWITFSLVLVFLRVSSVIKVSWLVAFLPLLLPFLLVMLLAGWFMIDHLIRTKKEEDKFQSQLNALDPTRSYAHKNPKPPTNPPTYQENDRKGEE